MVNSTDLAFYVTAAVSLASAAVIAYMIEMQMWKFAGGMNASQGWVSVWGLVIVGIALIAWRMYYGDGKRKLS
jgi:hypothetical protein